MLACILISATAAAEQPQSHATPDSDRLSDIVITGERIARRWHETTSSVAVVTQEMIEAQPVDRVDDLLASIPNVQLGNGSQGPAIRGMDTTGPLSALPAFLGGNRPRTTIVVDGRAVTYNEFVFGAFPLWDVDRIEVFRSPQTTTQGQNSIAGAIFVHTNDPSLSPEYRARAIAGDYRTRQLSALASGPLVADDLAFRLAGDFRYSRTTSRLEDVIEGGDPNHDVYGMLRAKLLFAPWPATRVALAYVHSQSQAPQIVGVDSPFRSRRDDSVGYGVFRINVDALTATVRHEASADLTLTTTLTAGDSKARRLAIPGLGQTRIDGRDWSGEALLGWSPDGPMLIVGGVSYGHVRLNQFINLSLLSGSIGRFRDRQEGTGIFIDSTIRLSPRATLTSGIRYQRDRQDRQGALTATTFVIPVDFVGTFDAWLPKVTFAYDLTPDFRLGAMVQKAYNPGGTTIRVDTVQPDNFEAETLWDYELFARARLAGRMNVAANAFYYDMRNAQRSQPILLHLPSGRAAGFANLFNVPRAQTYGAEAELTWFIGERISARAAIGLLATKIVQADAESAHLQGKQFDRAPHFTGSAAVDWKLSDRARISAQLRHHSPYFSDPQNSRAIRIPTGTSVNARGEYKIGRLALFAQARNVFDALNMRDLATPTSGEAEDPRRIAVGVEALF